MSSTRPRGFAPWTPRRSSAAMLDRVQAILTEYQDQLPLTVRQIYYRLVGTGAIEKTELAYHRLRELLNRARRAEIVPFEAIRDDSFAWSDGDGYRSISDLLDIVGDAFRYFRLDAQSGQPRRIVLACEAAGMKPQLDRIAEPYSIPTWGLGGFDSVTSQHQASRSLAALAAAGVPVEVLFTGDCDPSGAHIANSAIENVRAFCRRFAPDAKITFTPIAVTLEQAALYNLPTAPPKKTDRRSFQYDQTVQAEALPPSILAGLVQAEIDRRIDTEALFAARQREAAIRAWAMNTVAPMLQGIVPAHLRGQD